MKKIRNLLAICAITVVSLISTGCSGKDATIYMDGETPKYKYEKFVGVREDSPNIEEHYNVYEIDGEKYYSHKSENQYVIKDEIPSKVDVVMNGETFYLSNVQITQKLKMNAGLNIVDKQIKVIMNGPVVETNGQVDPSNPNIAIFEFPSSLNTAYAYTQKAKDEEKKEIEMLPIISGVKDGKWYSYNKMPKIKLENPSKASKEYYLYINGCKVETYDKEKTITLGEFFEYQRVGKNKIYLINDLGVKSEVINIKYDYPMFITRKVSFFRISPSFDRICAKDIEFYTRSGIKSIKIGKKNINVKKVKKAKKKYRYKIPAKYIKEGKTLKIKTKSGDTLKWKLK